MPTHSDKALTTIRAMGTLPEQWVLCPIEWRREECLVPGDVTCPECKGEKYVKYDADGEVIPPPDSKTDYTAWSIFYHEAVREARKLSRNGGNCKKCQKVKRGWGNIGATGHVRGLVKAMVVVGYTLWPEGCEFDSRFKSGCNCNLCNKLVMKSNLIPVIAKDVSGRWHGMRVGQDCVKKFLANVETVKGLNEDRYFADAVKRSEESARV